MVTSNHQVRHLLQTGYVNKGNTQLFVKEPAQNLLTQKPHLHQIGTYSPAVHRLGAENPLQLFFGQSAHAEQHFSKLR
jgi:hypothetical protein